MAMNSITQLEMILETLKVLLASLTVVFLFGFFIQWKFSKYRLPVVAFYTKKRFVKHNIILGTGIIALSLTYIVEFLRWSVYQNDTSPNALGGKLIVSFLETIAFVCIGYSYYKLLRQQIPS